MVMLNKRDSQQKKFASLRSNSIKLIIPYQPVSLILRSQVHVPQANDLFSVRPMLVLSISFVSIHPPMYAIVKPAFNTHHK